MPFTFEYDPAEKRLKHKWNRDEAGFLPPGGRNAHGQCPASITNTPGLAKQLLNNGIPWPPGLYPPECIYNVHRGVVYRAEPTEQCKSYHGFPEREQKGRMIPGFVLAELAKRAIEAGEYRLFSKWVKRYLPVGWSLLRHAQFDSAWIE